MKLCRQICRHHFKQQTLDNAHMDLGEQQTEVPKYLPYSEGFALMHGGPHYLSANVSFLISGHLRFGNFEGGI